MFGLSLTATVQILVYAVAALAIVCWGLVRSVLYLLREHEDRHFMMRSESELIEDAKRAHRDRS